MEQGKVAIPAGVAEKSLDELQVMFMDALKKVKTLSKKNEVLTGEKEAAVAEVETLKERMATGAGPSEGSDTSRVDDLEAQLKVTLDEKP
jgi:hypothetical protein